MAQAQAVPMACAQAVPMAQAQAVPMGMVVDAIPVDAAPPMPPQMDRLEALDAATRKGTDQPEHQHDIYADPDGDAAKRADKKMEMEDKARTRMDTAEGETYRLKGLLMHMEHVAGTLRGQGGEGDVVAATLIFSFAQSFASFSIFKYSAVARNCSSSSCLNA
mgnify:CR=1 FL=1